MSRICIVIAGHLATNPRPCKEALALAQGGHEVRVHGVWYDPWLADIDAELTAAAPWKFSPVADMRPHTLGGRWHRSVERVRFRLARERFVRDGKFRPALLGYCVPELLTAAAAERADLTIVHSEAGLWIGSALLDRGLRVGVDFEDWYSMDLLPEAQRHRPTKATRSFEAKLARGCAYCVAPSHAMAIALAEAFDAPRPTVVYNSFPDEPAAPTEAVERTPGLASLHWYSQTIGPGRGLELVCEALSFLEAPAELHLRGQASAATRGWLFGLVPASWRPRVFLHDTVPPARLAACIAQHDIGLALETDTIPSRDLTVTNKILQYMQAGLAVVATGTAGQREVFERAPGIGAIVPNRDPRALADALTGLIRSPQRLEAARTAARAGYEAAFAWEQQRARIQEAALRALGAAGELRMDASTDTT